MPAARYTISMDQRLLDHFDKHIERKGYANRSEAIRDLIRNTLVEEEWAKPSEKVAATVTLIYNHHAAEVADRLTDVQHHHGEVVVATTHVHLDNDNCLEVVILRGKCSAVRSLSEKLIALKGIKHGKAVFTTEGRGLW